MLARVPASRGKFGEIPALSRNGNSPNARSKSDHRLLFGLGSRRGPCACQGLVVRDVELLGGTGEAG